MITEAEVEAKIAELSETKASLIRKASLIDPNNTSLFYSTKKMEVLSGTEGVTPVAIGTLMSKVGDVILDYVDEMKGMPFIRSSPIFTQKKKTIIAVEDGVNYGTALLQQKGENLHIQDILPILDEVQLISSVEELAFSTSTVIESEDRSTRIDYEVILYKINPSNNEITTFRSGMGDLNVTIGKSDINIDDIYILGVVFNETIDPNIPYYADLSFLVSKTTSIAGSNDIRGTISGLGIGLQNLDVDVSLNNGMLYSSFFGFNDIIVLVESSIGTSINFTIGGVPYSPMGKYDGNCISQIGTRGKLISISDKSISVWQNTSTSTALHTGVYDIFESEEKQQDRVIFNNLRPIDVSIEEAIDAL
jgi:hypothetical protein